MPLRSDKARKSGNDPVIEFLSSNVGKELVGRIISKGRDDAPNYRPSTSAENCAGCNFADTNRVYCELYDFTYDLSWVCDSFEPEGLSKQSGFTPPEGVRSAAKRGLRLRRKYNRGGLSTQQASAAGVGSGVQRASNLASGSSVSIATVRRMRNFFSRHLKNYRPGKRESDGGPTAGTIAWLLWGGNAGRRWADSVLRREGVLKEKINIAKVDPKRQMVFGFFSINKVGDELVEDREGDLMETEVLEKAAYDYVLNARVQGEGHLRKGVGRLVESIVLTYEKQSSIEKCLADQGIDAVFDLGCEGWFGGFKVDDAEVWKAIENGDYPAFSVGGSGTRKPVRE